MIPARSLVGRRRVSAVRIVGRLEPPPGLAWRDVLASPRRVAETALAFHELGARVLALRPAALRLHRTLWAPQEAARPIEGQDWHHDACSPAGHVLVTVGDLPTEFLLGDVPDAFYDEERDLAAVERAMRLWRPAPGEVVHIDRETIHRRPHGSVRERLFLLASRAPATRPARTTPAGVS